MKRLILTLLAFGFGLAAPIVWLVLGADRSLKREEAAELKFFAETLFDAVEEELADLVRREEARPIDAYVPGARPSLAQLFPMAPFILGWHQVDPDGAVHTPHGATVREHPLSNLARPGLSDVPPPQSPPIEAPVEQPKRRAGAKDDEDKETQVPEDQAAASDRWYDMARRKQRAVLGQENPKVEELAPRQALNLIQRGESKPGPDLASRGKGSSDSMLEGAGPAQEPESPPAPAEKAADPSPHPPSKRAGSGHPPFDRRLEAKSQRQAVPDREYYGRAAASVKPTPTMPQTPEPGAAPVSAKHDPFAVGVQVEVAPLQALFVSSTQTFLYRRILINGRIYRQGFIVDLENFLQHLIDSHFSGRAVSRYTAMTLTAGDMGRIGAQVRAGATRALESPEIRVGRVFPRPFGFLSAEIAAAGLPMSTARIALWSGGAAVTAFLCLGLLALYKSAAVVMEASRRRSDFVSSVTHELKTPLTAIRLYADMLKEGMVPSEERKSEYFGVISAESARLTRLIENVLEFARLEKRTRPMNLVSLDVREIFHEVESLVVEKARLEGFVFRTLAPEGLPIIACDKEALVQALLNCVENAFKFGRDSQVKEIEISALRDGEGVEIAAADRGPGIPPEALSKVFDDFYRAESALTAKTGGTGIGLSLVRRYIEAMGGRVRAENRRGGGCRIVMRLPAKSATAPTS